MESVFRADGLHLIYFMWVIKSLRPDVVLKLEGQPPAELCRLWMSLMFLFFFSMFVINSLKEWVFYEFTEFSHHF